MERLTKEKLERILNSRLSLKDPQYFLEKAGHKLVGNIVSPTFKGKRDHIRQKMIWDALEAELGHDSVALVGMLLAFAPEEWNIASEERPSPMDARMGRTIAPSAAPRPVTATHQRFRSKRSARKST